MNPEHIPSGQSEPVVSGSEPAEKKRKNRFFSHLLSLLFGTLLGCLILLPVAYFTGLISFGEKNHFYDTAISYYSENFGDSVGMQSQNPSDYARFYTRAADTSILNSSVPLDFERILQENVLLEKESSGNTTENTETELSAFVKEITGKKLRLASKLQETCVLDGISRNLDDLTINGKTLSSIPVDSSVSRLYQRVYLSFSLESSSDGTLLISQNSNSDYQIPFTANEKKQIQIAISLASDSVNFSCDQDSVSCNLTDLTLLGSRKTISVYTGASISFDETSERIISGTVTAENAGFLFLPIPYNEKIKASVDGIETDLLRANACFVCVPVGSGEHRFSFEYPRFP